MEQTQRIPFLHANGPRGTLRPNRDKPAPAADSEAGRPELCISSRSLFGNASEIFIRHCGSEYRLRITRQDKLILTK